MIFITDKGLPLAEGSFAVTVGSLQRAAVEAKKFTEIHAAIAHPVLAHQVISFMVCRVVETNQIGWLSDRDVVYVVAKEWNPYGYPTEIIYRCEFRSVDGWGSRAGVSR